MTLPSNSEVLWIQSNVGNLDSEDPELVILQDIRERYRTSSVVNYAQHDPSIRWIKSRFLHQEDYEYRVNVFQFAEPIIP